MSDTRKYHTTGRSSRSDYPRYNVYETKSYFEERTPSKAYSENRIQESRNMFGSSGSLRSTPTSGKYYSDDITNTGAHRDYLYNKYSSPKRNTLDESWAYKSMSRENVTRSVSPRPRSSGGNYTEFGPSGTGRPFSALSKSPGASPYSSRAGSRAASPGPILKTKYGVSHSRSVSPKTVHIGPVTEMIEYKRELERHGQQEYFRGRDSRQGKVSNFSNEWVFFCLFFDSVFVSSSCLSVKNTASTNSSLTYKTLP